MVMDIVLLDIRVTNVGSQDGKNPSNLPIARV